MSSCDRHEDSQVESRLSKRDYIGRVSGAPRRDVRLRHSWGLEVEIIWLQRASSTPPQREEHAGIFIPSDFPKGEELIP